MKEGYKKMPIYKIEFPFLTMLLTQRIIQARALSIRRLHFCIVCDKH